jgi:hypothetical protein
MNGTETILINSCRIFFEPELEYTFEGGHKSFKGFPFHTFEIDTDDLPKELADQIRSIAIKSFEGWLDRNTPQPPEEK